MKTTLRRAAVALTAACALTLVAAAPASASTTHNAVVTGGTVTLVATGQSTQVISLVPDPTSTCPATTVTVANANESDPTGTSTLTSVTSYGRFFFGGTAAANHYITVITGNSTTGTSTNPSTWNATTGTFTGLVLRLTVKIYLGSSTCTVTAANLKCTWTSIVPLNGTYSGDISHPTLSDTATAHSSNPGTMSLGGTCAAPFTTYTAGTATVSGMTIHITSS